MSDYKSDFVIITALKEPEFEKLKDVINELYGKIKMIKDNIYEGEIGSPEKPFQFYIAYQNTPGMVSTAILATKMIKCYRPQYIVMLGIAAGVKSKDMIPGSVLVADFVANYQLGKVSGFGFQQDGNVYHLDATLRTNLDANKNSIMGQINAEFRDRKSNLKTYIGHIVSGNQVVASQKIMDGIKKSFRKAIGVEMEGYAIFQAADEANGTKPLPILIKSVCDFGNKSKNDNYRELAAYTSAKFFLKFALKCLTPIKKWPGIIPVEVVPWQHQKDRETTRFNELLSKSCKGSTVKFISITGRSFLAPYIPSSIPPDYKDYFDEAINRGVKFQGIILDPKSPEAKYRSDFESPGKEKISERLLFQDSKCVTDKLDKLSNASNIWKKNLKIYCSRIGLSFKLWLFEEEAYIEPYHFGKQKKDCKKEESPLCAFSHIWIKKSVPEYELLVKHFDNLWKKSKPFWPKKK